MGYFINREALGEEEKPFSETHLVILETRDGVHLRSLAISMDTLEVDTSCKDMQEAVKMLFHWILKTNAQLPQFIMQEKIKRIKVIDNKEVFLYLDLQKRCVEVSNMDLSDFSHDFYSVVADNIPPFVQHCRSIFLKEYKDVQSRIR